MLHVLASTGDERVQSGKDNRNGELPDSVLSPTRDPLNLFDGTEFAKSTAMNFSQDFSDDLLNIRGTYEDIMNLDNYLQGAPDPVFGDHYGDLLTPDAFSNEAPFDKASKSDIKKESVSSMQLLNDEEIDNGRASSSSTSTTGSVSPPMMTNQGQYQQPEQQQQRVYAPRIAFNNGFLQSAPPVAQQHPVGNFNRLVKVNPQMQQPIRGSSNYSAYSPPPTPSNSKNSSNSRGAQYARQYRQKNREHIEQLEGENDQLRKENDQLRDLYGQARTQNERLSKEVNYLRQVLQNQSAIASILNSVTSNTPGLKFQFPITNATAASGGQETEQKRTIETRASSKRKIDDHQQSATTKKAKGNDGVAVANETGPGICLHVNGDMVSVEFCARCNREARCVNERQQQQ